MNQFTIVAAGILIANSVVLLGMSVWTHVWGILVHPEVFLSPVLLLQWVWGLLSLSLAFLVAILAIIVASRGAAPAVSTSSSNQK